MISLEQVRAFTGITTYNASDSVVTVAQKELEDYVRVSIKTEEINKVETGVDVSYVVPVSVAPITTISIELLPNSEDSDYLNSLQDYIQANGGYFRVEIINSGKFMGTFSCFFLKEPDTEIDLDPSDEIFEFGAVREDRGLFQRPTNRTGGNVNIQPVPLSRVRTYPYEYTPMYER